MIKLSNALLLTLLVQLAANAQDRQNVYVQDDARVGLIVTGEGNTLNTTQVFGKSPEYAELKSALDEYEKQLGDKVDLCDEMKKDGLPERYIANCMTEVARLNRKRDSIQNIEKKFRNDVLRLAALFDQVEVNSERILIAQRLFEKGQITEADAILKVVEMQTETEQLLAKRDRLNAKQHETDSLLIVKSDEWLTKALLTEVKFDIANWQDSVLYYYQQSIRCKERFPNLLNYVDFFYQQNRLDSAELYLNRLIKQFGEELTLLESIDIYNFLGRIYTRQSQNQEAEQAYLRALALLQEWEGSARDSLLKYKANLLGNLGVIYRDNGLLDKAEEYQLESLRITKGLRLVDTVSWLENLAKNHSNLGEVYRTKQEYELALEQSNIALKIRRKLVEKSPNKFGDQVGKSLNSLGGIYRSLGRMSEAEEALEEGEKIWIELEKVDRGRYALGLSVNQNALGNIHLQKGSYETAEAAFKKAVDIRRELASVNPSPFLSDLAKSLNNLAILYSRWKKPIEAKITIEEAIQCFEKLKALGGIVDNKELFKAYALWSGALFLGGEWNELKDVYKKVIKLAYDLAETDPETFEIKIAKMALYSAYIKLRTNDKAAALKDLEMTKEFSIKYFTKPDIKRNFFQMIHYFGWEVMDSTLAHLDEEGLVFRQAYYAAQAPEAKTIELQKLIDLYEKALAEGVVSQYFISSLAADYSDLSYFSVVTRNFEKAEKAARRGIQLDASQPWILTNLAMALLFQGKYEEAKTIYEEKKGEWMEGVGTWNKVFLDDLADMETQGVTHPDVEKIRALLGKD
ncbi:MAG: tetratricopeptide repeat protein [Saprospiraceae bacterium]|nr:tetratricopeptide repeat protein [Saprospiraceae bacterium]